MCGYLEVGFDAHNWLRGAFYCSSLLITWGGRTIDWLASRLYEGIIFIPFHSFISFSFFHAFIFLFSLILTFLFSLFLSFLLFFVHFLLSFSFPLQFLPLYFQLFGSHSLFLIPISIVFPSCLRQLFFLLTFNDYSLIFRLLSFSPLLASSNCLLLWFLTDRTTRVTCFFFSERTCCQKYNRVFFHSHFFSNYTLTCGGPFCVDEFSLISWPLSGRGCSHPVMRGKLN